MNNIYHLLLSVEFIFAAIVFIILFFVSAPYGRFVRRGWGPVMPARWAWILQELPAFSVILLCFIYFEAWDNPMNWVFLLIWESHYFQRTFIYPFQFASGSKPYPALLVIFAIIFNSINGFVNGYFLFHLADYDNSWFTDPRMIMGIIIFAAGYFINKQSDSILKKLKKQNQGEYAIPHGGWFRFVSCPHYFGEILEWTGWAILTWSLPGLAFAVFTFANLAPRAWSHHKWYRKKFPDYPKQRRAVIPFIW